MGRESLLSWYIIKIMNHSRVHYYICFLSLQFYPFTHLFQTHFLSVNKRQGIRNTLQIAMYVEILAQSKIPLYMVLNT